MVKKIKHFLRRIMGFFISDPEPCQTCDALKDQIVYLKKLVEQIVKERECERAEYKRAIDVILFQKQVPTIGQGYTEPNKTVSTDKLFGYLEEEIKKEL